ncbi:MAG: cysteine--tRNA ligase [Defluviitaleaceae bacterium]|nr:cysteine--tRNA ligase [Defluviitaleaceae bacterium]
MKIYNSLTRKKEDFYTIEKGKVRMYVCGPTVYDFLHIGNARPMVVFDTVRRYLQYKGYEVDYVQNFTDIDDKIIAKATSLASGEFKNNIFVSEKKLCKETNTFFDYDNLGQEAPAEIAKQFTEEALKDMKGLNLLPARNPKVTEEMPAIISMIETLITKGHAYISSANSETSGDVYFHVPSYESYGALKTQTEHISRLEENSLKKHSSDFVLWKKAKQGEPSYESPWGAGRPGWHIECSAMAKKYLGSTIDIHAGGIDLLFPHHENEIAQSTCANDANFANFFMHNNFLNINEEKMSKSTGNFFTIREIAEKYSYNVVRFFILSSHYRSEMNFSDEALRAAKAGLDRIQNCINGDGKIEKDFSVYKKRFEEAMEDDFNTSNAIAIIFELVSEVNKLNASPSLVKKFCDILGLDFVNPLIKTRVVKKGFLSTVKSDYTSYPKEVLEDNIIEEQLENMINKRNEAKKNKDFTLADKIRDELKEKGITLIDTREGTKWLYDEDL